MSQTVTAAPAPPARDERIARRSVLSRLLARPELGALVGAIVSLASRHPNDLTASSLANWKWVGAKKSNKIFGIGFGVGRDRVR